MSSAPVEILLCPIVPSVLFYSFIFLPDLNRSQIHHYDLALNVPPASIEVENLDAVVSSSSRISTPSSHHVSSGAAHPRVSPSQRNPDLCTKMVKSVATLDKHTTCLAWNYSDQRLATGSADGTISIFDSPDPASSSFATTIKTRAHEYGIVKVIWVPPEYGDAVAGICEDEALSL